MPNHLKSKKQNRQADPPKQEQLLFIPGTEGWKNPLPNPLLIPQAQIPKPSGTWTTRQIQERLGIPGNFLNSCRITEGRRWNASYSIWHLARNCWEIHIKESA